jgi:hypothetical protein
MDSHSLVLDLAEVVRVFLCQVTAEVVVSTHDQVFHAYQTKVWAVISTRHFSLQSLQADVGAVISTCHFNLQSLQANGGSRIYLPFQSSVSPG